MNLSAKKSACKRFRSRQENHRRRRGNLGVESLGLRVFRKGGKSRKGGKHSESSGVDRPNFQGRQKHRRERKDGRSLLR